MDYDKTKDEFSRVWKDSKKISESYLSMSEIYTPDYMKCGRFMDNVDFNENVVVVAPHGGAIAVAPISPSSLGFSNPQITLYDSGYHMICEVSPKYQRRLNSFYLTADEMLVCVHQDSTVCIYNQRAQLIVQQKVVTNEKDVIINFVAFWETGFFIATYGGGVYAVEDFGHLKISKFADTSGFELKSGVAVGPRIDENGAHMDICLYAAGSHNGEESIVLIERDSQPCAQSFPRTIYSMQFSANHSFALIQCEESILLYSADFSQAYMELEIPDYRIHNACWCGDNFVAAKVANEQDEQSLVVMGLSQDTIRWTFPTGFFASTEADGLRILTKDKIYYLEELAGAPLEFVKPKGVSNGLSLLSTMADRRSSATTDPIETLGDRLPQAVDECLEAVHFFRDVTIRKQLLGVVARAHHNLRSFNSASFSKAIMNVRLSEFLAKEPYFMPMTFAQLSKLRWDRLITRLCNRFLHLHAYKIAEYLNERTEPIYVHWAHSLVRTNLPPEDIIARLKKNNTNIDYVDLATVAHSLNNEELARALLKENLVKSHCVPLHIKMGLWGEAIEAAVESNDTSLVLFVFEEAQKVYLQSPENMATFREYLSKHPIALDTWFSMNPEDPERAKMLINGGRIREGINVMFEAALQEGGNLDAVIARAKEVRDSHGQNAAERFRNIKQFLASIEHTDWAELTPYEIFEKCLQDESINIKKAASALGIDSSEFYWRDVNLYIKTPTPRLLGNIVSGEDEDMMNVVSYFCDIGQIRLARNVVANAPERIKGQLSSLFESIVGT